MAILHRYGLPLSSSFIVILIPCAVLSPSKPLLVQRATDVLTYAARRFAGTTLELSPLVVSALVAFGAKEESLASIGTEAVDVSFGKLSPLQRRVCLTRLVYVIKCFIEYVPPFSSPT